jgi:uncharacterized protein YfbU (UPF0304 family)
MSNVFDLPKRLVSVNELDTLVRDLKEARKDYDMAKIVSNGKSYIVDELENKLIELLAEAGKTVYEVEGCARVTIVSKTQVTTPKTIENKELLFKWIENRMGKEALTAYQSINYQSLNSLYNKEMEETLGLGKEWLGIDGLDLPMSVKTLQMRSK